MPERNAHEDSLPRPSRPGATLEKQQPHLHDEARHIWESYKKGVIRDISFRQDRLGVATTLERNCAGSLKPMPCTFRNDVEKAFELMRTKADGMLKPLITFA